MAWTAYPCSAGDTLNASLLVDNLDQARRERLFARADFVNGGTLGRFHTSGDVVQNNIYGGPGNTNQIQPLLESLASIYLKTTIDFAGDAAPADPATWPWGLAAVWAAAGVDPAGWHVELARTFDDVAGSTTYGVPVDVHGAPIPVAAVDGHKALHTTEGRVYERVAGVWVLLGGVGSYKPDKLVGQRQAAGGDYFNHTMMNEMYAVADLYRRLLVSATSGATTRFGGSPSFATYKQKSVFGETFGVGATFGPAKTDAEANYAAATPITTSAGVGWPTSRAYTGGTSQDFGGTFYTFRAHIVCGGKSTITITATPGMTLAFAADFLVRANVSMDSGNAPGTTVPTFDGQGADVVESVWHLYDSLAAGTGPKTAVPHGVDPTAAFGLNWCADPPSTIPQDMGKTRGYVVGPGGTDPYGGAAAVCYFDVAGGFAMA